MIKDWRCSVKSGSYLLTTDRSLIDLAEWIKFIESHPNGNIFQTAEMSDLHSSLKGHRSVSLFCIDEYGNIAGVINAVIMNSGNMLSRFLTSRAIVTGGPLIRDGSEDIAAEMMAMLLKIIPGEVIYLQVRNLDPTDRISDQLISAGFTREEHLNFLVDLAAGKEEVWRSMHPTRRKQVRRAEKRGVTTVVHNNPGDETINKCYDILENVYKRAKLPLAGRDLFDGAFKKWSSAGILRIITAHCEERIIGFRIFFVFRGRIYDWYAGSDPLFSDRYPNDILPWRLMEWGMENRCTLFDFGGAGNPREEYGVRDYKRKFGGQEVNFGRYLYVRKPILYSTGKFIFKVMLKKIAG